MSVRRTRLAPWPFPWITAFPGANWPQHLRTGSSHRHGHSGLERQIDACGRVDTEREAHTRDRSVVALHCSHSLRRTRRITRLGLGRGAREVRRIVDAAASFVFRHLRVRAQWPRAVDLSVRAVRRGDLVRRLTNVSTK